MSLQDFIPRFTRRQPPPELALSIRHASNAISRERDKDRTIDMLSTALIQREAQDLAERRNVEDQRAELQEAIYMGGAGPWRAPLHESQAGERAGDTALRESTLPFVAQGAYGDAELMLNNIEWKRETSMSWLEFTRWGIQQIILIARLRCLKDPMLKRGVDVSAQYVFGRGVEITSEDEAAAEVLKDWRERNATVFGHSALTNQHRAKFHDGNLFWINFTDRTNTGLVNVRTLDAVEMMDVITNPDDTSEPWYYRREWIQQQMDQDTGARRNVKMTAWYPALNYEPAESKRLQKIDGAEVMWDSPVYHRRCGAPGKWHFGLPIVYAALPYAQAVKRFLEDCMTIRNSLAQFSMLLTTKGGQQALQGAKTQLSTGVGPSSTLWDPNPPAVAGAVFASGPGTELKAFNTKGSGGDPSEVREYKLMVQMVFGCPESFWANMDTSNLATATSLDRPTELNFMEQQEVWVEDLTVLALYQLRAAKGAVSGRLIEARENKMRIVERTRILTKEGRMVYEAAPKKNEITVMVNFPSIIEADVPANIAAIALAATLGNKVGEYVGIDEKQAVRLLNRELDIPEEVLQDQYPEDGPDAYDPLRTKEEPLPGALDPVTGLPVKPKATPAKEALSDINGIRGALSRLGRAIRLYEAQKEEE